MRCSGSRSKSFVKQGSRQERKDRLPRFLDRGGERIVRKTSLWTISDLNVIMRNHCEEKTTLP